DRIYPQFATHNAHTVSAILEMAKDHELSDFEFQRLHGMGEALHSIVKDQSHTRCRIYAPVGAHRDLLAYLVRRLLENGANSSFVNQIVDETVPAIEVAACPLTELEGEIDLDSTVISTGPNLFMPERANSVGYDLSDITVLEAINAVRTKPHSLSVGPMIEGRARGGSVEEIVNPANGEVLGEATFASLDDVETAMTAAMVWDAPAEERARVLSKAADLYEENYGRFFALLACEAGKTLADAVAELREAVDFLRYYAANAEGLANGPRGIFTCISPWNFPLAIFSGQISAALAAGNAVLAKPAETTSAIGAFGVELMQQAGVPKNVLQLLPGLGATVGAALVSDARVGGVVFTGSTATARRIQGMMADHCLPGTPLIAETGGLNAMIVDSTALPEQAIRDIVASAFQSAGQRCSALRCLYVQEDIAPAFKEMLTGAMNELDMGDPWCLSSDLGPVITPNAQADISAYVNEAKAQGRLLHRLQPVDGGNFVAPALIAVNGIGDLTHEVFGPILHLATFPANGLDQVVEAVNATGYGLTFGLHTRIDDRVQSISQAVHAGNVYANRNQIGAIVGSQPFGGEGLSGTGPKAGGPHYLGRFTATAEPRFESNSAGHADINDVAERIFASGKNNSEIGSTILPGPTGELNRLTIVPRMPILCVGPGEKAVNEQVTIVKGLGGNAVGIPDNLSPDALGQLVGFAGVLWWGDADKAKEYAKTLAELDGPIIPLITSIPDQAHVVLERHLCVDTTAAGGNTSLLSGNDG
ncbi:MAG: bifunctional proline dehydrogenase/L-glutamate gamma-semialdehyde dehydrogenase PutA, partial [Paracoccaceae bacterium]|nr:bifunctional proline dehydrogenase/L-glutamate gamma-semialdehyde dehydrogenase PutA [Paracoccaceae bacterium]